MDFGRYCSTPLYSLGTAAPTVDCNELPHWPFVQTTVLARAIRQENPKHVRALLRRGCSPNKPVGQEELRPLMIALYIKNKEKRMTVVKCLFAFHVNPMLADSKGTNSLMYACAMSLEEEVRFMINNYYMDFKATDDQSNTVLHYCAMAGSLPVLDIVLNKILRYSLSINGRNRGNHTPLDIAILQCSMDCIQMLQKSGGQCTLPKYRRSPDFLPSIHNRISTGSSTCSDGQTSITYAIRKVVEKKEGAGSSWRPLQGTSSGAEFPPLILSKPEEKKTTALQCPDDVICRLLSMKAKRSTLCYCRPQQRAPLDSEWVKSTQASMTAAFHKKTRKVLAIHSSSGSSSRELSEE